MAAAGTNDTKSPKAPPRQPPKTPEARQVHFETPGILKGQTITGYTTASSPSGGFNTNTATGSSKAAPKTPPAVTASEDNQPTSFPALGFAANSQLQWHTSANPTQSLRHQLPTGPGGFISPPTQQAAAYFSLPQQHHPQIHPASYINTPAGTHNTVTYIGVGPPGNNTMGDYQNAAPPNNGVHFQPPVPDTTFGPMQHVYVPRFDGGLAGVQVGLPAPAPALTSVSVPAPAHFVSAPAPLATAACTTVVLPKTFYLNGYTYYASGLQPVVGAMAPQPGVHASYVVHQQPYLVQQPAMGQQQPVLMHAPQQHYVPQVQHVAGAVPAVGMAGGVAAMHGAVPIIAGNSGHIPDVTGIGRTAGEEQLRQIQFAHENRLYEPQDFKPADDDPSRFYYVREVDGNWTQRNRFTIDHMGDCRWYVTDEGWFYAVRLPS
ncbi:hypothetical protein Neosp_008544 [[Neocosmospora] mangrovei]